MKKDIKYIVVRDGFWWGVVGDAFMYGCLGGLWYLNYHYLGNSWFIGFTLGFMIIVTVAAKFTSSFRKVFYSYKEALDYLKSEVEEERKDD